MSVHTRLLRRPFALAALLLLLGLTGPSLSAAEKTDDAAAVAKALAAPAEQRVCRQRARQGPRRDSRKCSRGLHAANESCSHMWHEIKTREAWAARREKVLAALRQSLGTWPEAPKHMDIDVTGKLDGDGFIIQKLMYESRPGWWVTANLYRPAEPRVGAGHPDRAQPPQPQDPGRAAGHGHDLGPRRLHGAGHRPPRPRRTAAASVPHRQADYPQPVPGRPAGLLLPLRHRLQLHLVGDSLMGWMAWDLMRGVDVLLAQTGHRPGARSSCWARSPAAATRRR